MQKKREKAQPDWAVLFSFSDFDTEYLTSETGLHVDKTNVNNRK